MKKKSKVVMISAAVAAVSMFTVTAFASTPQLDGYKAFKEVLKANQMSEQTIESGTVNGDFTVTLNGETVLEASGQAKMENTGERPGISGDFDFNLNGFGRSASIYSSGDDSVYLIDETHGLHYQVINIGEEHSSKHGGRPDEGSYEHRPMNKAEEALLDYIVGDLKNNFSVVSHADGSKTIEVLVSKEEVPLPVRMLIDVASAADRMQHADEQEASAEWEAALQLPFFQGLEAADLEELLPELVEDVAIERVRLQLTVDQDNMLQRVQGELEVSGKDEAGITHHVKLAGGGGVSGVNATTPDVYDPAGHSVDVIDAEAFIDRS